jgi:two-component system response regulator
MRGKEILLVEDNEDDVFLTRRALDKSNILNKLVVARDGVEALEYLFGDQTKTSTEANLCPVLILLDLKLPRIDGLQVLKQIGENEKTCLCSVVILTSSREEVDVIKGYKLGANSFIRKPVSFDQFVDAVRQLGLYWLVLNELPPNLCVR